MEIKPIAHIYTGFPEKFGIPRQSGLAGTQGTIVFEPEYRVREALRGIEGYSHLWLLWLFDRNARKDFCPTVRPPRLGGNIRMGVFATRSPFRPNPIGLSCVELAAVEQTKGLGTVLHVVGADLADATPIVDIKPYLTYTDSRPHARGGFSDGVREHCLQVVIPPELLDGIPPGVLPSLREILAHDPRPGYLDDEKRLFGFEYCGLSVKFTVKDDVLTLEQVSTREKTWKNT